MHKKLLMSVVSVVTAFTMVITPCVTVFATDPEAATDLEAATDTITVNKESEDKVVEVESVTVEDGKTAINAAGDGVSVEVSEDVTSSGNTGSKYTDNLGKEYYISNPVVIADDHAEVLIKGDLNANGDEQDGIRAHGEAIVMVEEDVNSSRIAVNANNANVYVGGNVSGSNYGINADNKAIVYVDDGRVQATGMHDISYSDYDKEKKDYNVKKETLTGTAIDTDGTADIYVNGDVIGTTLGIGIYRGKDTAPDKGNIIIDGTISVSKENASRISINNSFTRDDEGEEITAIYNDLTELINGIPNITLFAMDKGYISIGRHTEDESVKYSDIRAAVLDTINYIIKQDSESVEKYGLKLVEENNSNIKVVKGTEDKNYNTVSYNKAFQVAANVPDGYMLSGGECVQVNDNGDGTFTLTLKDLRGGISLRVVARPVPNTDKVEVVEVKEETPTYADPTAVPAGAIVATTTTAAADTPAETAAISGTKPALTVAYSINEITPLQYKNSIIQSVATAPSGGAFNIQTDKVACFDRKMIEAFAARPDVDVNVVFTYGGRKLKVVIPAGFDVRTLLDEFGYCGFLRLMSILGASELNPVA